MRRGGVRAGRSPRWVAAGVVAFALLAATACQAGGDPLTAGSSPAATPTRTVPATRTPAPVDPRVTTEVCGLAVAATTTTITVFNEQMAAFEQAAARNDQAGLEGPAKAINDQFESVAEAFTLLSDRPVDPALHKVLVDIAAALTQISSVSYTGTAVDIRRKLVDFTIALAEVCATATPSGSPAPG